MPSSRNYRLRSCGVRRSALRPSISLNSCSMVARAKRPTRCPRASSTRMSTCCPDRNHRAARSRTARAAAAFPLYGGGLSGPWQSLSPIGYRQCFGGCSPSFRQSRTLDVMRKLGPRQRTISGTSGHGGRLVPKRSAPVVMIRLGGSVGSVSRKGDEFHRTSVMWNSWLIGGAMA
jgi:hypothetical protein